mgnify:CR=1 FL=1
MGDNNWIQRYTLGTGSMSVALTLANRVVIRVTEDTRIAYDTGLLDSVYFTLLSGTTLVLDPPLFIEVLWFQLDTAASGVVEIWATG